MVLFDHRLRVRVADVDVGVGKEPDLPGHNRLDRELAAPDGPVVEGHLDRDEPLLFDGGQEELEGVVAQLELEPRFRRFAAGDDGPAGGARWLTSTRTI